MTIVSRPFFAAVLIGWLVAAPAQAQQEAAARPAISDDSAVWAIIERAWRGNREGNNRWVDELLSADFVGWSHESPAPRDRASTRLWTGVSSRHTDMLEYELYPLSIIVHGDTAVAHYLFTTAMQDKGEPVKTVNGRFTDVLVRGADGWRILSWHGGPDAD